MPLTPPEINAVEVVAAQPTETESATITALNDQSNRSLQQIAFVVKVQLKTKPPVSSIAWALYLDDVLIPKYWEYNGGIYFTVLDPQFFVEHKGKQFRFSFDGVEFFDTQVTLAEPAQAEATQDASGKQDATGKSKRKSSKTKSLSETDASKLPSQADVLK